MTPSVDLLSFYSRLERILKNVALRVKVLSTLEFLLRLASVFLIILLGSFFVEEAKDALPYLPFAYCLLVWISLILIFSGGLLRIVSKLSLQQVARGLEKKFPWLKDDVTNSFLLFHEISRSPESRRISKGLVTAQVQKTVDKALKIDPKQAVPFRKALSHLQLLIPLCVAFLAVLSLEPRFPGRALAVMLNPLAALPERQTFISVTPLPPTVLRGTPLMIQARATGYVPDRISLRLLPEKGRPILLEMKPEGKAGFSHLIPSVQASFRAQVFSDRSASHDYHVNVVDAPDIANIMLTLSPPAYTGLAGQVLEGGHVEALKGTVVGLKARATKKVKEGKIVLGLKNQLILNVTGEQLAGSFPVFYPGTYSLSVKDEFGFENTNPVKYNIHLTPDKYPEVEIISPANDSMVSGSEVLPISYTARDDFGVTAVRLIYQVGGLQRSVPLKYIQGPGSAEAERFNWDLSTLALTPGDRVVYRIEALDNDTVSGPKAGYSKRFNLQLKDEKQQSTREAERAAQISEALLGLLADQLEDLKDQKARSDDIAGIMEKVDQYLERMEKEKMERYDLESLRRNLDTLYREIGNLPREKITQEMERLALLAEDLFKKARMREVETVSREIKNRQKRMIDALAEHQGPLTPEALQNMLKELDKLKELAAQVMEALSQMAFQLPDEFMNSPELEGLNLQDMFQDFDTIRQKLMAGDLKGALEAARRMLQNLSEMMAAMARAGSQARMGSFNRLQSEMNRQSSVLDDILKEQQGVLAGTGAVQEKLADLAETETRERLDRKMPRLKEILSQLRRRLSSEAEEALSEMERFFEEERIDRLAQLVDRLGEELAENPQARGLADEMKQIMDFLTPSAHEVMTQDNGKAISDLFTRQDQLQGKTKDLGETLDMLSQLFPGMDTKIINDIKNAAGSMGRASGKLNSKDADGAIPPEEEAIRYLSQSQQGMQQMAQQMAQQMQANRWGNPMAYDPRGGWYHGPWGSMPTLSQPEVNRRREQGYTGFEKEEFDPPAPDAYQAPRIFREKVMEALKEEVPSRYQKEVKRYFKGLTE
ncbi:MAG: DUF4175 family protein [Desulfobacterales bacterium]|nr:DUF4175 family protein [Desulfobacterales bacterium]